MPYVFQKSCFSVLLERTDYLHGEGVRQIKELFIASAAVTLQALDTFLEDFATHFSELNRTAYVRAAFANQYMYYCHFTTI